MKHHITQMKSLHLLMVLFALSIGIDRAPAQSPPHPSPRSALVLQGKTASLRMDLAGGSIAAFQLADSTLNPLLWNTPKPGKTNIQGFGHFLCLDRWGPPSDAEGKQGMPYHGEAANVAWTAIGKPTEQNQIIEAQAVATLPIAGLTVRRSLKLSQSSSIALIQEEVTNINPLGRVLNIVQHPTIAPPFLDEQTWIDCNGRRGFAQGGSMPTPESPAFDWPMATTANGQPVNLRTLNNDPQPSVTSFIIDEPYGWITASSPRSGLLIGYLWKTSDYPWVSHWRDVQKSKPAARGLEFGSTGLHQPFPILVQKGRIWDRPLLEYLDSKASLTKHYAIFLLKIPSDFAGVSTLRIQKHQITVVEHRNDSPRELTLDTAGLIP